MEPGEAVQDGRTYVMKLSAPGAGGGRFEEM
jgi:hypothetical protein